MTEPLLNGLDIKEEADEVIDQPDLVVPDEIQAISDIDFESTPDLLYFDDIEAQTTQKCVDNCKIIIKDFETQLDWHLNNYMKLRNIIKPRGNTSGEDLKTMESINEIIASRSLNKKKSLSNGSGGRRKRKNAEEESDSEEEDDPSFDEDEDEEDEEEYDSEDDYEAKGPARKKIKTEDEIEEEYNELVVPKEEDQSEEEEEAPPPPPPKAKGKGRGAAAKGKAAAKPKKTPAKTPAKRGRKKKQPEPEPEEEPEEEEEEEEYEEKKPTDEEFLELIQPKLILKADQFQSDPKKPMVMLDETNFQDFNFESDTQTNCFVIPFEDADDLPYFIFENKDIIAKILSDDIKLVLNSVYEGNFNK